MTFREVKRQEARRRSITARAGRSPRKAKFTQRSVSLVGSGNKWQITNLHNVAQEMSKWV